MSVLPLIDADRTCGRKAHGLAALLHAGLPVPDGFVVTDPAVDPRVVAEHLGRLRGRAVAVRSSGLAEDSATASFAGQLETVLGARGLDEVLAAVRSCAASPHTNRARSYRAHLDLGDDGDDGPAAPVLVQQLVEADHAGVLFTRDPRTGAGAVVINASWGLGESVVSGAVVPDEVIVTPPADTVRVTVGAKQTRLDLREHGLVRSPVPEPDRARGCVTPDEVDRTREGLLDAQAHCWVSRSSFADLSGWSLTGTGRRHNEAQLRDELDRAGARRAVAAVHEQFLPPNARASQIFTAWQLDSGSPADTLRRLAGLASELLDLERPLAGQLGRFAGYHDRFTAALARADHDPAWITGVEVDSCHRVWFEFHEDLIATLGIAR